ncbi:Do family serine endopeptidase [Sphingomonas sp. MMS12-HWE2-04]|uniref:Do family serine endopeptidase n=1 Tax=Sphingomonas sp. MMS12-HWE2-04 TaxID=3234199 RepID=UPI00384E70B9
MRYAYALSTALLLSGAAAVMTIHEPAGAQTAQNEPGAIQAAAPKAGAPMSFADMVAKLQPAVVNISTTQRVTVNANPLAGTPFEMFGGGQQGGQPVTREAQSLGSGFIISADGYVVTNNHVISADQKGAAVESITVTLPDKREFKAKLIGRDPSSDLAVLKIDGTNLPFVRFGDSKQSRVGDWVVAIGNPFGLGGSVTAGIISATHRVTGQGGAYDRFIQTDASINRGNSGGPMFDLQGNVIGINSQILSPTGGNVGIGFAIPAEEAKPVIDTLMKGGAIKRGYLGIGLGGPVDADIGEALGLPKNQGEIIARVEPDGPAAKAGLRPGDVVTQVNGKQVNPDQTLSYLIANVAPGSPAKLDVIRDGKRMALTATVANRPSDDQLALSLNGGSEGLPDEDDTPGAAVPAASIGLNVVPLTPQIARSIGVNSTIRGVVVVSADPRTDAGQKLKRGDVIQSVNNLPVATAADLARAVGAATTAGRTRVALLVTREKLTTFVSVRTKD